METKIRGVLPIRQDIPIDFALLRRKRKYIKSKTKAREKRTSIAAVRDILWTFGTFPTPPFFSLPTTFKVKSHRKKWELRYYLKQRIFMSESHQELKKSNKQIFDQKVTEWMLKITIFPTKALQKNRRVTGWYSKGWAGKMSVGIRIRIRIRMFIYLLPLYTYNVK